MKKEAYFEPEIEITKFVTNDVMLDSGTETPIHPSDEQSLEDDYPIFNVHD